MNLPEGYVKRKFPESLERSRINWLPFLPLTANRDDLTISNAEPGTTHQTLLAWSTETHSATLRTFLQGGATEYTSDLSAHAFPESES